MTGFGAHAFDQIQWALNKDKELPVEICAAETNNLKNRSPFYMKYADDTTIVMPQKLKADLRLAVSSSAAKARPRSIEISSARTRQRLPRQCRRI